MHNIVMVILLSLSSMYTSVFVCVLWAILPELNLI